MAGVDTSPGFLQQLLQNSPQMLGALGNYFGGEMGQGLSGFGNMMQGIMNQRREAPPSMPQNPNYMSSNITPPDFMGAPPSGAQQGGMVTPPSFMEPNLPTIRPDAMNFMNRGGMGRGMVR